VFRRQEALAARIRRVQEEAVTSTSEILREIKTVRQFAMEATEATNYARGELTRHLLAENGNVVTEALEWVRPPNPYFAFTLPLSLCRASGACLPPGFA
jgi:hypothetical protein